MPLPFEVPAKVGKYRLLELLGRGGMGAVYKAWHSMLKCEVAVKALSPDLVQKEEIVARFQREMAAIGRLQHPNLVRAMDADVIDGTHILVMEYIDGVDLGTLVERLGPLPVAGQREFLAAR